MGWQQGGGDGMGDTPSLGLPGQHNFSLGESERRALLAGFASGGEWDQRLPGPELAAALAEATGPEWRCHGAEPDELIGVLRRIAALESWASAAKLGVIRELIRQDDLPSVTRHGDLPDQWSDSVNYELSLALASSVTAAQQLALVAWELGARLPNIAALLAEGTLSYSKAKLISETFQLLSDEDAARAEAILLPQLTGTTGKTWGQVLNLATRAANQVDPGLAERRRKAAVKHAARVQVFREQSGTAAMCGRDLPPGETLTAYANVTSRTAEYKDSGAFPDATTDQLRSTAYLDLLNDVTADARIAYGHLSTDSQDPEDTSGSEGPSDHGPGETGGTKPPDGDGPNSGGPGAHGGDQPAFHRRPDARRVLTDLIIPLGTLLGLTDRPGESHGLGVLDPALCRELALLAAASEHTQVCVTVTSPDGIAIGHGCGRLGKRARTHSSRLAQGTPMPPVALPARLNLTITVAQLSSLVHRAPGSRGSSPPRASAGWALTCFDGGSLPSMANRPGSATSNPGSARSRSSPGDPSWCGTWTLTMPGGRELDVGIEPVPTHACDHRHESHAYQPNDTLRHLVEVRDHECTFPSCSRHARSCDYEHAQPYDKGGRTCACNAGARSRKCHRVKQSAGWNVNQPKPGWHVWTTPSGRTYTQVPYQYPV